MVSYLYVERLVLRSIMIYHWKSAERKTTFTYLAKKSSFPSACSAYLRELFAILYKSLTLLNAWEVQFYSFCKNVNYKIDSPDNKIN